MQIHRIMVALNRLPGLQDGAEMTFAEAVGLLDEGDAIVARLEDGSEALLMVRRAHPDSWEVTFGAPSRSGRLVVAGSRALRLNLA